MPESAEEVYAGSSPRSAMTAACPWLPPRRGESDKPCWCSESEPANAIWRNERWVVTSQEEPGGLPLVLSLQPREHLDFSDMGDGDAHMHVMFIAGTARMPNMLGSTATMGLCSTRQAGGKRFADPRAVVDAMPGQTEAAELFSTRRLRGIRRRSWPLPVS